MSDDQDPTVHLDAISAKTLRKTYHGAIKAIWPALGALRQTAPNSRDFKNDVNALRQAEREHMDRIQRLEQVLFDLYMLYGSVPAQARRWRVGQMPESRQPMTEVNRDTRIDVLQRHLTEMRIRKGPHSKIAKTLAAALRSGTDRDLAAGLCAYTHFDKYYEQLTLEESRWKARPSRPPTKGLPSPPATKQDIERAKAQAEKERKEREWREALEKRRGRCHTKRSGTRACPMDLTSRFPTSYRPGRCGMSLTRHDARRKE